MAPDQWRSAGCNEPLVRRNPLHRLGSHIRRECIQGLRIYIFSTLVFRTFRVFGCKSGQVVYGFEVGPHLGRCGVVSTRSKFGEIERVTEDRGVEISVGTLNVLGLGACGARQTRLCNGIECLRPLRFRGAHLQ